MLIREAGDAQGAYLWDDGALIDLGSNVRAAGLNDLGQVVGIVNDGDGWAAGTWLDGTLTLVPTLRFATAISNHGLVGGVTSEWQAAVWDGETQVEFRASEPLAITADGTVLGSTYVFSDGVLKELVASWNGELLRESEASAINDAQTVVGLAIRFYQQGSGPCRNESCEWHEEIPFIWSPSCFGDCCAQ